MDFLPLLTRDRGKTLFLPAHGRGVGLPKELVDLMRKRAGVWDLPELPDLGGPLEVNGAIAQSQAKAAEAVGAERCWYGVNGATGLLQAAMLSMARPGQAVLMPRNVHRSLIQACVLGDLTPVLFDLPFMTDRGHVKPPDVNWLNEVLGEFSFEGIEVVAAVLVNPTYHGYSSQLKPLIDLLQGKGMPVLIDEAHGAHFVCGADTDLPDSGLVAGADLIVHSLHKSAAGLSQTAVLWSQGSRVDPLAIERSIGWLQTTSPNSLLIASCEAAICEWSKAAGRRRFRARIDEARELARQLRDEGLPLLENQDPLRLILHTAAEGISGLEADSWLIKNGIVAELPEPGCITFCLGLTPHRGLANLLKRRWQELMKIKKKNNHSPIFSKPPLPKVAIPTISLGSAWRSSYKTVPLIDAVNCIAAEMICPYPPGIPLLVPGEKLDERRINWLIDQQVNWTNQIRSNIKIVLE